MKRQIWGVPVVTNVSHPVGFATLLSEDSVGIFTDGQVDAQVGVINDDFGRNRVRARCEGRFQVGATRPAGIVNIDLAA